MTEIIKILIEEPERLRKLGLFIVKSFFNCILASHLYIWIFSQYSLIDVLDFKSWVEFILSGRVLICILLYLISEILLFHILPMISTIPLSWLAGKMYSDKPDRSERDFIRWVLIKAQVVSLDERTNRVSIGKNADDFYDFVRLFQERETKKEIISLKNSLLNQILHTYFVFIVVYYFLLDIPHVKMVNYIIVVGCIFLPLIYLGVCWLIEYMNKNAKAIIHDFNGLKFEQLIFDIMKEIGVYPLDVEDPKEKGYLKYVYYQNKEHILQFHYGKRPVAEFSMKLFRDKFLKAEKRMILITNNELTRNAKDLADEHKKSLLVITFKDETDLTIKLEECFKEK